MNRSGLRSARTKAQRRQVKAMIAFWKSIGITGDLQVSVGVRIVREAVRFGFDEAIRFFESQEKK